MKHKVILLLVLVALLVLAASVSAQATTTITIWLNGGANEATALQNATAAFTKETGIAVNVQAVDWNNAVAQELAAINSGSGADLYAGGMSYGIDYGAIGGVLDLKAQFPDAYQAILSANNPAFDQAIVGADGKVFGVPFSQDVLLMYYLPDKLKAAGISAPPTTWDELTSDVKALKAANEGGLGMGWGNASWLGFQPYLAQAGGSWYKADCSAAAINSDAGLTALKYYTSLYSDLGAAQAGNSPADFESGAVSILLDGEWQANGIDASYPDLKGKWAVAPLPVGPAGNNASFIGGRMMGIFSYSKNADASLKFIQWLQTSEASQALIQQELTVNSSLFVPPQTANFQYIQGDPGVQTAITTQLKSTTGPANCAGWEQAGSDINNELQAVLFNNGDYNDALTAMETTLNNDLTKYANATLEAPAAATPSS